MLARLIFLTLICLSLASCSDDKPATTEDQANSQAAPDAQLDAPLDLTAEEMANTKAVDCSPLHGITPYCGFKNPEDIVITPDDKQLLISEMGEFMLDTPGALSLFDLGSREKANIPIHWQTEGESWGDASCVKPDADLFSPHGIDLMTRPSGDHQLLVVNHGGRESVEFFALTELANQWQLEWKGCALPPEDAFINDVSGLNDGGFFVTHMWGKSLAFEEVAAKLTAGENTGWVWEWQPENGFKKLSGSADLMPNGIAVSKDNKHVFINIYMASKTIKIERASGKRVGEFAVQQPDNITIDDNGTLWVASHKHDPINQNCNEQTSGPCLLPFEIVKANANTMQTEVILSHDGAPMGYSTVVLKVGNSLFLGSAHGDRIVEYPLAE